MTVTEETKKSLAESKQDVYIFNPTNKDFTVKYAGVEYSIAARKIEQFKAPIANHIAKHLANKMSENDPGYTHKETIEENLKEIYVDNL